MRMPAAATLLGLLVLSLAAPAAAQHGYQPQIEPGTVDVPRGTVFIRNLDAVWTANGEVLRNTSILVRDGVIRGMGPDLSPPRGVEVVEGAGYTAIPGIVDEHSHIAMDRGTNEGTAPIVPEVRVLDTLDPDDFGIYRALSGGVTTALILHGSANPIGGQGAIIKTRWGMDDSRKLLVEGAPRTVKFALGENVTRKNFMVPGTPQRYPMSRAGVEAIYVQAFTAAQEYRRAWEEYRRNPRAHRVPPRRDLRLEALVDIMDGRISVHAHSYRSDEIVMLMRIAERFGFRIDVFTHVLEGYKVADEIAAHGAGASTFSDWWHYKVEAYDATPYNAAIMHERGVLTSLNSDLPWLQPFMVYELNKPVKYGNVSKEDALRMLTAYPAKQLRIDDRVGTLEVGKHADIVLLNGDPFDSYTRVERTFVDGILYYDRERDAELRGHPVREIERPAPRPVPVAEDGPGGHTGSDAADAAQPDAEAADVARSTAGHGEDVVPSVGFAAAPAGEPGNRPRDRSASGNATVKALVGATVHPVASGAIRDGVVLVQGGRILDVGPAARVEIPAGAEIVDLGGKHVYPGMIDPLTPLGLVEIGAITAMRDDREVGSFNPHIRALWSVHPHSEAIPVTRANGVTAVMAAPTTGIIRAAGSVIQLAGDTPERMAIADRAALVVDFPSPSGEEWDDPKLEGEDLEKLVDFFGRARLFGRQPSVRTDPTAPFEPNVWGGDRVLLESMVPVMSGEMPVFFRARTERDLRTLLLFVDSFPELRPVIVGGDQAFRLAGELAERQIPVVVGSALRPTMDRDDPIGAAWENAAILYGAGVKVAFTTEDVEHLRNLPYHAARSVAWGLPRDEALRAVTLNAAEILGLGSELGSIEPGKRADLIVTDGDPLQIVTQVERVFIGGEEASMETRHTRLYEQFRDRR